MLTWKDTSIGDNISLQAQAGAVNITLLKRAEGWAANCDLFGFWPRDLQTDDIDEAKRVACDMLYTELRKAMDALDQPPAGGE